MPRNSGMQPGASKRAWEIVVTLDRAANFNDRDRLLDQLAGAHMNPCVRFGTDHTQVQMSVRATTLASACSRAFQEIAKCDLPHVPFAIDGCAALPPTS